MYEALQRLFEEFLDTLDDESQKDISSFVGSMKKAFEEENQLHEYINSVQMEQICKRYEAFISESSAKSLTFAYWSMYIKMIGN